MKDFNRGGGSFGRRDSRGGDSRGRDFGRGGDRGGRPEMHKAICADCGAPCEVPFKPSGDRPVLCSNCFKGKDGGSSRASGRDFSRPSFGDRKSFGDHKPMFKTICAECGAPCEVPFKPNGEKPVLCSNCFAQGKENGHSHGDHSSHDHSAHDHAPRNSAPASDQFAVVNAKLDKILSALRLELDIEPKAAPKATTKKEEIKKIEIKKADLKISTPKVVAPKAMPKVVSKAAAKKVVKKKIKK